jgi:hypothetical protein
LPDDSMMAVVGRCAAHRRNYDARWAPSISNCHYERAKRAIAAFEIFVAVGASAKPRRRQTRDGGCRELGRIFEVQQP